MDKFPNEYEEDKDLLQKLYKLECKLAEKDFIIAVLEEKNKYYKECCNKLEEKNEELTAKQTGWIRMEDRVPEDGVSVLAYRQKGRGMTVTTLWDAVEPERVYSHWMPLPEPPKPKAQKFRKKPIVVEAYQTDRTIVIPTLEGDMIAGRGDYIITGVDGEQYPCKPDIFEKTYEPYFEEEGGE